LHRAEARGANPAGPGFGRRRPRRREGRPRRRRPTGVPILNRKIRILTVDDQADLRLLIRLTFSSSDYEVTEAANADEALAACERSIPDVALIDVMMPGCDGYQLCKLLRADPRLDRTVLIMMTASGQAIERVHASDAGADHYLPKPFLPSTLPPLAQSLLRQKRAGTDAGDHEPTPPEASQA
jgi:DNA-binding response OmpR family regulator